MPQTFKPTVIALDIETTDISPAHGEIIEIAAIKYRQGEVVDIWHSLVKPSKKIPPIVRSITGLTDADVAEAPKIEAVRREVAAFIDDFPLVGHNVGFDIAFLRAAGIGLPNNPVYDTWKLATIVFQGERSYSLESLTARLNLEHREKHRAEHDAQAGMKLFQHLIAELRAVAPAVRRQIIALVERTNWPLREVMAEVDRLGALPGKAAPRLPAAPPDGAAPPAVDFSTENLTSLLARKGKAQRVIPGYEYRPSQVEMMRYVAEAFLNEQFLLVEAPPGVGKSMAYLLPAVMFAKTKKKKVVISTYTHSLQNQLLEKDLPLIRKIFPWSFRAVLLKGRQQYICRRLVEQWQKRAALSDDEITTLVKILIWLDRTRTGEISEIALTREDRPTIQRLVSDYHVCVGRSCPHYLKCFVNVARQQAARADIIIANHALLLREPKFESEPVLQTAHLIIDEAHELEGAATDAYSQRLTRQMIDAWLQALTMPRKKGGLLDYFPLKKQPQLQVAVRNLRERTRQLGEDLSLFWGLVGIFVRRYQENNQYQKYEVSLTENLREEQEWKQVAAAAQTLGRKMEKFLEQLREIAEAAEKTGGRKSTRPDDAADWPREAKGLIQEGKNLARLVVEVFITPREEQIYWITIRRDTDFVANAAPRRVSELLQRELYASKKTLIMTSATLSTAQSDDSGTMIASFDYFKDRLGLTDFRFERVASEFDYKRQALIYLPQDLVSPQDPKYVAQLSKIIVQAASKLGGKTMVLFTSYSGIKAVYENVAETLKKEKIEVLAQGVTGGKMKLLQQFQQSPRGVLLGTATFWQGVDLPGEKLSCLIMAKLPFDVPTEPVFKARQQQYDNGFIHYAVPLAILRFRQGFGRLIRTKTDRGVMVIMDSRVEKSNFGLLFLRSLPECEVQYGSLNDVAEVTANWLKRV